MKKQYFEQPVDKVIQQRTSVRTYEKKMIAPDTVKLLEQHIAELKIPFKNKIKIRYIPSIGQPESQKLGTYGVIKNAPAFLGITVEKGNYDLVAAGYALEEVILYATSLGLGTCWLGGTFKKSAFADIMEVDKNQLLPAITPIGYGQEKGHFAGNLIRKIAGSNSRREWEELFFSEDFYSPLAEEEVVELSAILEGVRMAPSASNKQPWRIVRQGNDFHFYMEKTPGYNEKLGYCIQKVDLGIALCHFRLAAKENGYEVPLSRKHEKAHDLPENIEYIVT